MWHNPPFAATATAADAEVDQIAEKKNDVEMKVEAKDLLISGEDYTVCVCDMLGLAGGLF